MTAIVTLLGALLVGRLLISAARAALFTVCAVIVILAALAGTVGLTVFQ